MRENREVVMNDYAGVETAFADLDLPHWFARLRFDRVDKAVAATLDQQSRTVDIGNDGRRVRRIVRAATRRADPHRLAGLLVERHEAMRAASVLSPLEGDAADDYEIAIDDRRH